MLQEQLEKVNGCQDANGDIHIDLQSMGVNNNTVKDISLLECRRIIVLNLSRNQMTNETLLFLVKLPFIQLKFLDIRLEQLQCTRNQVSFKRTLPCFVASLHEYVWTKKTEISWVKKASRLFCSSLGRSKILDCVNISSQSIYAFAC